MWSPTGYAYLVVDEDGVAVIRGKGFRVRRLSWDVQSGRRPDELAYIYPELTTAEIYSGLAYCADNPFEGDHYPGSRGSALSEWLMQADDDFVERFRLAEGLELQYVFADDTCDALFVAA